MSKHRILWGVTFLISLFFSLSNLSFSAQERRTALVIGNGSYESAPLRNPVNDAGDIAAALRKLGFTTIHRQNATQREIEDVIREFGKSLRKGGVGLFYYAGHGLQVNGINYIIPLDARIQEETDVKYEAVDARRVLDAMYNAGNDFNIVILDACRDNPLVRGFRSSSNGLARMDAPKGTIIAYSTSPGKVALDGSGRNSPYTAALLEYMDDPGLTIEQVFKKCRRYIDKATKGRQIPWESTSLTGDFYFSTKGSPNSLSEKLARLERERQEFERLKAEFERKQRETQSQRIEVESLPKAPDYSSPSPTSGKILHNGISVEFENKPPETPSRPIEVASLPKAPEYSPPSGEPLPAWGAFSKSLPKKLEDSTPSSTSGKAQHTRISVEFENKPPETPSKPIEVASLPKAPEYSPPSGEPLPAWGAFSKSLPKKLEDSTLSSTSGKAQHTGISVESENKPPETPSRPIEVASLPKAPEYSPPSGEPLPAWGPFSKNLPKKLEDSTPSSTSGNAQHTGISVESENKPPETPSRPIEVASLPKAPEYSPPSGEPLPAWGALSKNLPKKLEDSTPSSTSDKVLHDGIYTAYANGIVKDTSTGLEWKVGPDRWYTWNEAKSWVESLNLDGGDWKMPTVDDLQGLYKKGIGIGNMTPLLKTPGGWAWSRETEGSSKARGFNFHRGSAWGTRYLSHYGRAFAVRSRSDG